MSTHIEVTATGLVRCTGHAWRAALGRGGVGCKKREGDGITPVGTWALGRAFWRADRLKVPRTGLETVAIKADWGWCDDPAHTDYNHLITLPHPARHEKLWREDTLYDVVIELSFNVNPVVPHKGSAIFLHVAQADYAPTQGCIALAYTDLLDLLKLCHKKSTLTVSL